MGNISELKLGGICLAIGPAMAIALLTTMYGAILANVICLPIAQKLVNPTQDYHSRRILDQEILSLAMAPTMPITSITDIKKLGPYIPYAISN